MADPMNRGASFPESHRRTGTSEQGVLEKAKDKAQDLASGAADLAGKAKEKVQDWASSTADVAGRAWEGTKEGARAVADTAENAWDGFNSFVRRNPVPSLLAAFGLGWCMGMFFSSNRNA